MAGSADLNNGNGGQRVFVSYARPDRKWAQGVVAALQRAGFDVWWDALIPGGERFSSQIAGALDSAAAVVVLWSANSVASDWVRDEAGVGRDKHALIPLRIDRTPPPLGFRQLQAIDISASQGRAGHPAMQDVVRAVADQLGQQPVVAAPGRATPMLSRRAMLAGAGVAALAAGGYFLLPRLIGGGASANSIAVLPFDNLSGDHAQQYLSDGLAAELRARLSRNAAFSVVGSASSKSAEGDNRTIARQLKVAYLLGGNVRIADGVVRVGVELIDGSTGFSKWSNNFDRPMTDLLDLQETVAAAVVAALEPRLEGPGESRTRSGGTSNAEAFDLYLRGKESFDSQADEQSDRAALDAFDAAIAKDSNYAAALAARARALAVIANQYAQAGERRRLYADAVASARRAIAAAADYPEGHAALGYALFYGMLDIRAADQPYEQAARLGAGNADVLGLYAVYRARRRQFPAAEDAMAKAVALDPINASLLKSQGRIRFAKGDYDGAIASAREALRLNPSISGAHGDIGNALLMQGKLAEADSEFVQEKVALLALPGRAIVAAKSGKRAEAEARLAELVAAEGDNGLYQQAQILAQLGRADDAFRALDQSLALQDSGLVYLFSDPFLAPVANDARYKTLSGRLHFI